MRATMGIGKYSCRFDVDILNIAGISYVDKLAIFLSCFGKNSGKTVMNRFICHYISGGYFFQLGNRELSDCLYESIIPFLRVWHPIYLHLAHGVIIYNY